MNQKLLTPANWDSGIKTDVVVVVVVVVVVLCYYSFLSDEYKFTGDYFNLSDGRNIQPSQVYVLHVIINNFFIECMYSFCSHDQHLHFPAEKRFCISDE